MNDFMVYLIDDDPELITLLCDAIELIGLKSQGFTQGRVFFEQLKKFNKGDILVLDLLMPEMDGIEVIWTLDKER